MARLRSLLAGLLGFLGIPGCAPAVRSAAPAPPPARARVRITCDSREAARRLLDDATLDTGDTGGVADRDGGAFSVDAMIDPSRMDEIARRPGVTRIEILEDAEANRRRRMNELQGRPAFR